jgi:hypothetical protein
MCNGKYIPITRNLDAALRVLQEEKMHRMLWVDAICIDQENISEKSHQVPLMKDIFELADQVIIWLGEIGLDSEEIFQTIMSSGTDFFKRFLARFGGGTIDLSPMERQVIAAGKQTTIFIHWYGSTLIKHCSPGGPTFASCP